MHLFTKEEIEGAINIPLLFEEIKKGLIAYSENKTATAPLSFLHFDQPPGDVHIKAGAIQHDDFYIVKIASGFYENPKIGFPSSNGVMLLFSQRTGELYAILHDEGKLTDIRTGIAGAICAKYVGPKEITRIGIVGTGTQAKEQLFHLQFVTSCREVLLWGRSKEKVLAFARDPRLVSFNIQYVDEIAELAKHCNLIVTATASKQPFLFGYQLKPGTHITAVGADGFGKQEIDPSVFAIADLITADSLSQCLEYGDLAHAQNSVIDKPLIELGAFLKNPWIREDHWITVTDLTGIAVEDLQIAKFIVSKMKV